MLTMTKREMTKRLFLAKDLLAFEYPFVKHLEPLDFQVWCMMLDPQQLLIWSTTDEFQSLSRRIYNTNPILEAWDYFMRWFWFPEIL